MDVLNPDVAAPLPAGRLAWRWAEWAFLFVVVPVGLRIWWQPAVLLALLVLATAGGAWWLARQQMSHYSPLWRGRDERRQLRQLLWRFVLGAALLVATVWIFTPAQLFILPRTEPQRWLAILAFYPLLSVYPQELIYRALFFARYRPLFRGAYSMALASAAAFGFVHVVFQNWPALLLTLLGGWLFASTYARTYSLRLVWLEHSLYGALIFTVGLGNYFYHGSIN